MSVEELADWQKSEIKRGKTMQRDKPMLADYERGELQGQIEALTVVLAHVETDAPPLPFEGMRVCPRCGDKRCPRAWTDADCVNVIAH